MTNLFFPILLLRYMLHPRLFPIVTEGSLLQYLLSTYFQITFTVSLVSSSGLAICRFISIKFPFYILRKKIVLAGLAIATTVRIILALLYTSRIFKKDPIILWFRYCIKAVYFSELSQFQTVIMKLKMSITALIAVTGFIASILTVLSLKTYTPAADTSKEKLKKSAIIIVCMNICNVLVIICYMFSIIYVAQYRYIFFLGNVGSGIIAAAFNPTLRVVASKDIWKYFHVCCRVKATPLVNQGTITTQT